MDFKEKYNRITFLNFLEKQFLPDDFNICQEEADIEFKPQFIKKVTLLGDVDSLNLKVYEIEHTSEHDPRVGLSKEAFRLMANYGVRRALSFFISSKSENYRFSLMTIDLKMEGKKVLKEYSNPRRYSFYLGPDAKVHTPERFLVKQGGIRSFEDLVSRFAVEVVTKEFFEQYRELYEKVNEHLKQDRAFNNFARKNNIDHSNFAKKLLGQVVFLYFIQRKGWLGAPKDAKITEGDRNFLRSLFNRCIAEDKNFFNNYLEYLFYDTLNKKPDYAGSFYRDYFKCQTPFLNGGLFEPLNNYKWQEEFLHIPNEIFSDNPDKPEYGHGVLDVFDLYNFTVAEDDPMDREVSIDPEMLGKVFENLLEENLRKSKGTYYTPREIVHYMCQESLINYLVTESGLDEKRIRNLITRNILLTKEDVAKARKGDRQLENKVLIFWEKEAYKLDEILKNIKIVDPACGSGAFLVGMLQEITRARQILGSFNDIEFDGYQLRKETIQNSIYGVDIDLGAVEIAKLRLWLSLVVDYELGEVEPLPNLDYKIMQGNSLLEDLVLGDRTIKLFNPDLITIGKKKMKNLFEEEKQKDLFDAKSSITKIIRQLDDLRKTYFEISDLPEKLKVKKEIEGIEEKLVKECVDRELKQLDIRLKNIGKYLSPGVGLTKEDAEEIAKISSTQGQILETYRKFEESGVRPYFLWHLYFADAFQKKGGFDVVIVNPPYIGEKSHKETFREIRRGTLGRFYQGKMDILYFFFHLALNLGRLKSQIAFITTNYYITAMGARNLRQDFHKRAIINRLINFNELKLFEAAQGQHNMITLLTKGCSDGVIAKTAATKRTGSATPQILQKILAWEDEETDYFEVKQKDLYEGKEDYIRLFGIKGGVENKIVYKIQNIAGTDNILGKLFEVKTGLDSAADYVSKSNINKLKNYRGVAVGDGIFILRLDNENDTRFIKTLNANERTILKPFFKNSDIRRYWSSNTPRKFILYITKDIQELSEFPNIDKHLSRFQEIILDRREVKSGNIKYFHLHWPRYKNLFIGPKIIVPYRVSTNTFAYNEIEWFCRTDVYIIKEKQDSSISLKYALALLNSKLYLLWFRMRGKKKGEVLELAWKPLTETPIKKASKKEQKPFIDIVNKILTITKSNDYLKNPTKQAKVREYEKQINQLVYKLYNLTDKEIKIIEKE